MRKGIILSGGSGTRLHPLTLATSKQLLPVYNKPMIYYPLACLMEAGIREILLISTPHDIPGFKKLFNDGSHLGISISYAEQKEPKGIAEALLIAEPFLQGEPSTLILGDNLFYSNDLSHLLKKASQKIAGATLFAYEVKDPERYGVVNFDKNFKALSIEEKPLHPKSKYAVTGLYFYDGTASQKAHFLKPSERGELEITDLNMLYLQEGTLSVEILTRGSAWLDAGTHESLLQASHFVQVVETRQGNMVGAIEEIAFLKNWISKKQLCSLIDKMGKSSYSAYLNTLCRD